MKTIPLAQGRVAIVDDSDIDRINQFKWSPNKRGEIWYAVSRLPKNKERPKQISFTMHRFIMDAKKGQEIDHINHNGLDNRKINLRFCTHQENVFNRGPLPNHSSEYKGVQWVKKRNRWRAKIRKNGKDVFAKLFRDEIDAAKAYDVAVKKHFGKFAYLNFGNESLDAPKMKI